MLCALLAAGSTNNRGSISVRSMARALRSKPEGSAWQLGTAAPAPLIVSAVGSDYSGSAQYGTCAMLMPPPAVFAIGTLRIAMRLQRAWSPGSLRAAVAVRLSR